MGRLEGRVLAVFGSSGRTGRQIVAQAEKLGGRIRGLVREGGSLDDRRPAVVELVGELVDGAMVERTLEGADTALLVFGPRPPFTDVFCAPATAAIVAGMRRQGVGRIVCQTGAMVGGYPRNQGLGLRLMAALYRRSRPEGAADREEQERLVRASGLQWTLIKPPRLTDGRPSRRLRAGPELRVGLLSKVARVDVATFTLAEVSQSWRVGRALFLAG